MAIALVTGCSTGIGLATVLELARAGHEVVATARNPAGAEHLHAALAAEQLSVQVLPLDVDSDDSVAETFRQVLAERGHLDVLVNNAGISGGGPVEETALDVYRRVMETNYFGSIRCIQAVLPTMRERGSGCIVNVTSVAGRVAMGAHSPYNASKYAMEALSESLAAEVKPFGIRVAMVEPGVIATPIFGKAAPPVADSPYRNRLRLRKMFEVALRNPVPPSVVAEQIREIVEGASWQLRYPVGPDAMGFIQGRAAMTDEEWIETGADDGKWAAAVKRMVGLELDL